MYTYRKLTPKQRAELVQQRLAKGYPPHRPPHPLRDQSFYLITAACYEHQPHLASEQRRSDLLNLVFQKFTQHSIGLRGWVVLPNHYHLLIDLREPDRETLNTRDNGGRYRELEKAIQKVHGSSAYQWNREEQTQGRTVWYAYIDRAIRSEHHYYTTLNYIHYNPVKHGWAASPYDWLCSSVHWYLDQEGREWLRDSWVRYPVKEYGQDWDD